MIAHSNWLARMLLPNDSNAMPCTLHFGNSRWCQLGRRSLADPFQHADSLN